jgi:hypothetical protein
MLTLYTDSKYIKDTDKKIISVDISFDSKIYDINLNKKDYEYMKLIDNAEYDENTGMINTPLGKTEIQNLSSGCKTLILLNHSQELGNPIIYIGECGTNALNEIYKIDNIRVYCNYYQRPDNYNPFLKIHVNGNNDETISLEKAFDILWK